MSNSNTRQKCCCAKLRIAAQLKPQQKLKEKEKEKKKTEQKCARKEKQITNISSDYRLTAFYFDSNKTDAISHLVCFEIVYN